MHQYQKHQGLFGLWQQICKTEDTVNMYLMKFIKYGDSLYLTYLSWDRKTEKTDMAKKTQWQIQIHFETLPQDSISHIFFKEIVIP